jgi:predicted HTH transcriptional regulator
MTLMLPDETESALPAQMASHKITEQQDDLLSRLSEKFATADALAEGKKLGKSDRTIADWIKTLLKEKKIAKIGKGQYCKI